MTTGEVMAILCSLGQMAKVCSGTLHVVTPWLPAMLIKQVKKLGKPRPEVGEKTKFSHYQDLSSQFIIVPVATETLGTWGKVGLKFLKDLGKRIIEATGEKRSTCYLFQTLSMAVQRGNQRFSS